MQFSGMHWPRQASILVYLPAGGGGWSSTSSTLHQGRQSLPGMLLLGRANYPARRSVQGIAWPAAEYRPPIGVPAPRLKEDNGALDQPQPRAGQALGEVPMDAAHERSDLPSVARERSGPTGAQDLKSACGARALRCRRLG